MDLLEITDLPGALGVVEVQHLSVENDEVGVLGLVPLPFIDGLFHLLRNL